MEGIDYFRLKIKVIWGITEVFIYTLSPKLLRNHFEPLLQAGFLLAPVKS